MKFYKFLVILFFFSFHFSKAQMPGMGGSNSMNGMNNVPQNTSNNGPSKKDEPPHGGDVKEAGKYSIEIVFDPFATDEKMTIWVLKQNYKTVNLENATGKVKIRYVKADGKEENFDLIISEDKFICNNIEDGSQAFTAFITIVIKGKEYHAVYNHKAM